MGHFSTSGTSALGCFPPWGVGIGRETWRSWVKKEGGIPVSDAHSYAAVLLGSALVREEGSFGSTFGFGF